MPIRKNTRRFDPRYFMDEKTDIIEKIPKCQPGQTWVEDVPGEGECVDLNEARPKDVDPYERPLESPLAEDDTGA